MKVVLISVGTAISMVWLVWAGLVHAQPPVSAQVASFAILSDTRMSVLVTVDRPDPSIPASCRVLAQSTDFQPVGEQEVPVEASGYKVVDIPIELTTLRRATSASVRSCTSG